MISLIKKTIDSGVTNSLSSKMIKRIRVLNFMLIIWLGMTLLFSLIELSIGPNKERNLVIHLITFGLIVTIFLLQKYKYYVVANALFIFTIWLTVLTFAFFIKPGSYVEYYLMVIPAFSLIFFDNKAVNITILLVCMVSFFIPQALQFENLWSQAPVAKQLLFICVYALVNYFKKLNAQNETILANKVGELKKLKNFQQQFFLNVVHEIRTPLTIMGGYNRRVMKAMHHTGAEIHDLEKIAQEIDKIKQMTDDILLLSSSEGQSHFSLTPLAISRVVNLVVLSFEPLFDEKGISLSYQDNSKDVFVLGHRNYLEKAVGNLLFNAMKFTAKGGKVSVKLYQKAETVLIEVKDSGIGINIKDQALIFNRFYQVDNTITRSGGNGIGLSFTKEVVLKMNGNIYVESIEGIGSIFTIELPIMYLNTMNNDNSIPVKDTGNIPINKVGFNKETVSILLVDDHSGMRTYIKDILNDYQVHEVSNGKEALHFLKTNKVPNLLITDHMMPGMNGEDLIKAIRESNDEELKETPAIVVTAIDEKQKKIDYLHLGIDDFIAKPFHEEELLTRVKHILKVSALKKKVLEEYRHNDNLINDNEQGEKYAQVIHDIVQFINDNCSSNQFGISSILHQFSLTNSTLYRKVKMHTGFSPNQLIMEIRLQKADKILLDNPNITAKELVTEIGLKNSSHFKKLYRERFGKQF